MKQNRSSFMGLRFFCDRGSSGLVTVGHCLLAWPWVSCSRAGWGFRHKLVTSVTVWLSAEHCDLISEASLTDVPQACEVEKSV